MIKSCNFGIHFAANIRDYSELNVCNNYLGTSWMRFGFHVARQIFSSFFQNIYLLIFVHFFCSNKLKSSKSPKIRSSKITSKHYKNTTMFDSCQYIFRIQIIFGRFSDSFSSIRPKYVKSWFIYKKDAFSKRYTFVHRGFCKIQR